MTPSDGDLVAYIRAAKAAGVGDEFIAALLKNGGWAERSVYDAFGAYYAEAIGLRIPPSGALRASGAVAARGSRIEYARDAFLYLLVFLTLAWWTISLGYVFFTLIDRWIPDPSVSQIYTEWSVRTISYPLAGIVVAFPLFLGLSWYQLREAAARPELLESGVRKWLTYIALVLAACIVIGDVVTFIAWFLNGGLSTRFVWRVLVIFVLASGVFAYYLVSLRSIAAPRGVQLGFGFAALALVAAGLIGGFSISGTPADQRARLQDDTRLSDLASIESTMHFRWNQAEPKSAFVLPKSLAELPGLNGARTRVLADPVTGAPYGYFPLAGTRYRLCADFEAPARDQDTPFAWQHPAGRFCFTRDASENPVFFYRPRLTS